MIIFIVFTYYWTHTLPTVNGAYKFKGMVDTRGATLERDDKGMIHIKATNDADMIYAQGVVRYQQLCTLDRRSS